MSAGPTRRTFLAAAGLGSGAAIAASCASPESSGTAVLVRSRRPLPPRFAVPLPVPPVKAPVRRTADTDHYEIVQRAALQEIVPGVRTPVLGYDGTFPGPTIVSTAGRRTVVTHRNDLGDATVVHLHGGHTPADSDGYPTDLVEPGRSREYRYPMRQRAATLWYHDHVMDHTARQVYGGLAGFHLVHDAEETALPLPTGDRDLPLMITDRAFEADGSLRYPLDPSGHHVAYTWMSGVMGDVVLVNGAPWPVHDVAAVRYRLRLLNASNARRYGLELRAGRQRVPFVQVGSDGGLLAAPVEHRRIEIAPAERFDVVVDLSPFPPGTVLTLRNTLGSGPTADVMRLRVTRRASDDTHVPARLSVVEATTVTRDTPRRDWRFTRGSGSGRARWVVNGRPFDPERMSGEPVLGRTEVWRFYTDLHHPVHVHLDPFQVRRRGTSPPGPYDRGWKDTIDLRPAETAEVVVRFDDYAGAYLLHCHNLEHEDMAMMAAFRTTAAGG